MAGMSDNPFRSPITADKPPAIFRGAFRGALVGLAIFLIVTLLELAQDGAVSPQPVLAAVLMAATGAFFGAVVAWLATKRRKNRLPPGPEA